MLYCCIKRAAERQQGAYSGFYFDPELGSRGPNAAKNYLNHAPFGFRPLQLVVRVGVYR
jgi:hypothetical protein